MEQNPCPQSQPPDASDTHDFGHVVKNHAAMVHATARRITRDATLAEDVAQETFLALARQPHGALASVQAWLRRVTGRKALNAVRSESRRRRVEEVATLESGSTDEKSHWNDIEPTIRQTLEELPPDLKEPLVEHYLEGRTQLEIAARKATSQSTVSRQIAAGVQELKRRLRAKGILCGAGLTAFWSGQSANAAFTPWAGLLGKLSASTPTSTVTSTLITMNVAKASLAVASVSVMIALPFLIMHRQHSPGNPAPSGPPQKSPSAKGFKPESSVKAKSSRENSVAEKRYRPEPVSEAVRLKVDALAARFRNMSAQQKQQDPEFNKLLQRFIELASLNENEAEANSRMMAAMANVMNAKGIDMEKHGPEQANPPSGTPSPPKGPFLQMRFDDPDLDGPLGRSWLEAVVSDDHKRVADWIIHRVEGAALEYAFDPKLERTSEGVTAIPRPKKAKADE